MHMSMSSAASANSGNSFSPWVSNNGALAITVVFTVVYGVTLLVLVAWVTSLSARLQRVSAASVSDQPAAGKLGAEA